MAVDARALTITVDPTEVIVLPPNVVSSSPSNDVITFYTNQDIFEVSIMAGVAVMAIVGAIFLLIRRVGKN